LKYILNIGVRVEKVKL